MVVEVEEVGEEALRIKGSSAFMSSWSEEDDEEELSWFVYKSMAAIGKMGKRLARLKMDGKGRIFFFCLQKTELEMELTEKKRPVSSIKAKNRRMVGQWFGWCSLEGSLKTTLSSLLKERTKTKEEAKRNQKVLQQQTRTNPGEKKGSPDLCSPYLQGKRKTNRSK